ncbi:MAG: archaellin/type IV pilin N-terminal domain-containing protein [Candidatus Hydrothermarchaeota archaeon]
MKKTFQGIRKEEKGVSPVIAVILLIAIAVVAAGIAYVWVTSFTTGTTAKVSGATAQFDVNLLILEAKKNKNYVKVMNTGSANASDVRLYVNGNFTYKFDTLNASRIGKMPTAGYTLQSGDVVDVTCKEGAMASAEVK